MSGVKSVVVIGEEKIGDEVKSNKEAKNKQSGKAKFSSDPGFQQEKKLVMRACISWKILHQ